MNNVRHNLSIAVILLVILSILSSTQIEHIPEIMSLEPVQVTTFFNNATYAFMLGWDDGYKDLEMSFIEDDLNIRHTSWIVTTGMQEKRLWGLDQLFRGHDIQSHSAFHVPHDEINESYCAEILEQSIAFIQSFYGYTPIVFACPYGRVGNNYKTVLEYFEVGRGMHLEGDSSLGRWPITSRGKCDTSFIVNQYDTRYLSQKVYGMRKIGPYRAFKAWGHARDVFGDNKTLETFIEKFDTVGNRDDTWYTTWGEAIAYQVEKDDISIRNYMIDHDQILFEPYLGTRDPKTFNVPLTFKVNVPSEWTSIDVVSDGKLLPSRMTNGERNYVLFNAIPEGQSINIINNGNVTDESAPQITSLHVTVTPEGTMFTTTITDLDGIVTDVNMTAISPAGDHVFYNVRSPLFWNNGTYGRVVFNEFSDNWTVIVNAIDGSNNHASKTFHWT